MAAEYNFSIEKGSVFYISFDYVDENNQVIDLTNYCARLSLVPNTGTQNIITYFTDTRSDEYRFTISPDEGKIILQIPANTTSSFNFSNAAYDLDLKAPNELYPGSGPNIVRLLYGTINIISRNVVSPEAFTCVSLVDPDNCVTCE